MSWEERYLGTVCRQMQSSRDHVRNHVPLFAGLQQYHLAREGAGEDLTWPEIEAGEIDAMREHLRTALAP